MLINFIKNYDNLFQFDANLDVNLAYQVSQITDLPIEPELKADIFEAMSDCIRFAVSAFA